MARPTLQEFKQKALRDPEIQAAYEALAPAYEWRKQLIRLRKEAGLTQEQLATLLNTKKGNISRLENVNSEISPRLATIERYADAVGYKIEINFIPQTPSSMSSS